MEASKAQGRRQPPPLKPPCRNKGRVVWYSGSCPYSDWPPPLKEKPQRGPGPQEPEEELQPVQEMTTEAMQDTEGGTPGGLCPCHTLEQLPPNNKEAEPLLEPNVGLAVPQDNMEAAEMQGSRQPPPPKPPRRNKGRVVWYSGSCPYSDWPPALEERPQRGPGHQHPEVELQPVEEMSTEDIHDTEGDTPGGLRPSDTSAQLSSTNKEAEPLLEANVALPGAQDHMGVPEVQGRHQPPPKPPCKNKMTMGDMQDAERNPPGGLCPCDTTGNIPPIITDAKHHLKTCMALLALQDRIPITQGRQQPLTKTPHWNKGRVSWLQAQELLRLLETTTQDTQSPSNPVLNTQLALLRECLPAPELPAMAVASEPLPMEVAPTSEEVCFVWFILILLYLLWKFMFF
ncbi:uncharacterized protein LOC132532782 [Erinaceus europaeus]|uniref:Uncharacterized protein LOC132532782 n=1 Tax=Erinaceus europaeus TaxID=9365 RepID=A0ABM3VT96_ERIEU|nr:uncharacterized protein LOC132532782 [Erinaceus europaeus]